MNFFSKFQYHLAQTFIIFQLHDYLTQGRSQDFKEVVGGLIKLTYGIATAIASLLKEQTSFETHLLPLLIRASGLGWSYRWSVTSDLCSCLYHGC